ncbi:anchored repeat ABC transporter, substrate-binding protein [Myceligenerans pegani]|uniref:Anchored repeat ABC transporter, substrate-binding protein n=1 Tax=Myceligenerans pegani TaxID=2776917 RepID=A0ABR9N4G6_9MICO|nr:anchored repeat ABC transporter, substrate-binding protein [Myceligenerans sp. TRM 65318]MBE1878061.1 anchored repeat ABC transporter, substrate-binding protein [Myceligenerans sp. TRM 65318]MBE3020332.1 anchored repeat ABC transporter, substrate-binding protein [Myceligenerans sp. TRM 65318]
MTSRRRSAAVSLVAAGSLVLGGCASDSGSAHDDRLRVVTTTGILADLVRNVVGGGVEVTSIVPPTGDPHSYDPTLRDVRDVVYADVAFSNYLLLEDHAVVTTLDANLPDEAPNISLAESATKYAAEVIPLVENVNLDTIWLGLRVAGTGEEYGATRASDVRLRVTGVDGPGRLAGYLTETFGQPRVYFDSGDGFDAADGYARDTATLPADAHTHMSWAFTEPGVYRVAMESDLVVEPGEDPRPLGETSVTFAVGVDPYSVPGMPDAEVLDGGHADVTVDLDDGAIVLQTDAPAGEAGGEDANDTPGGHDDAGHAHAHVFDPAETVISVPNKALAAVPAQPGFGFLGRPGEQIYLLPQAVLGKHVHGEIDPHLWQDVRNAQAYVEVIRDTLVAAAPDRAAEFRANAEAYLALLRETDAYVESTIAQIPRSRRYLVTTHDAFAYLGRAYDVDIAGFVTPNPASEPSVADRIKLTRTVQALDVPAVFLEPNLVARSTVLTEVARENDLRVCVIYSDAFDDRVTTYVDLMRANADSLRRCLT